MEDLKRDLIAQIRVSILVRIIFLPLQIPPALSLAITWRREVGRAELVEILKRLEFFLMLVKGIIWSINANLLDLVWRLYGWNNWRVDRLDLLEVCH